MKADTSWIKRLIQDADLDAESPSFALFKETDDDKTERDEQPQVRMPDRLVDYFVVMSIGGLKKENAGSGYKHNNNIKCQEIIYKKWKNTRSPFSSPLPPQKHNNLRH